MASLRPGAWGCPASPHTNAAPTLLAPKEHRLGGCQSTPVASGHAHSPWAARGKGRMTSRPAGSSPRLSARKFAKEARSNPTAKPTGGPARLSTSLGQGPKEGQESKSTCLFPRMGWEGRHPPSVAPGVMAALCHASRNGGRGVGVRGGPLSIQNSCGFHNPLPSGGSFFPAVLSSCSPSRQIPQEPPATLNTTRCTYRRHMDGAGVRLSGTA
jgi:hypothetical protein